MRTILFILAAWHDANGVLMLFAPEAWYAFVPDVTETGPANLHFIRDIGLAFVASAAGLVAATRADGARVPTMWSAVWSQSDRRWYAVARDDTERQRLLDEVRRRAEALEQSSARLAVRRTRRSGPTG